MSERVTRRPESFRKPEHWSDAPIPAPREPVPGPEKDGRSPTRYGDWELNGIAVDF